MAEELTLVEETHFFPILTNLFECLKAELAASGGDSLCFIGLTPAGRPPLGVMTCKEGHGCGVAWISPVSAFPSSDFPAPDEGGEVAIKNPNLAMEIEVGVARCYPQPQGRESQADPQAYFEAMRLYLSDMAAMKRAIDCCFRWSQGEPPPPQHSIGSWSPLEPEARASGGTWQFWVQ